MKILLLGSKGQLGFHLSHSLQNISQLTKPLITFSRQDLDLGNFELVKKTITHFRPNIIINAAAYTAVDKAETEPNLANKINRAALKVIANTTKEINALLFHYSTDYIFDGKKPSAYIETDQANPLSIYGKSKFLGEEEIRLSHCKYIIMRLSWVYSAKKENFIKTIIRLAKEKREILVVDDQIGSPTPASLIASHTAMMIERSSDMHQLLGTYHFAPDGYASRYEIAKFVVDYLHDAGLELTLKSDKIYPVSSAEYQLPASRPKNSILNTQKFKRHCNVSLPDWQTILKQELDNMMLK